jgi:anti-anti-sigma factor
MYLTQTGVAVKLPASIEFADAELIMNKFNQLSIDGDTVVIDCSQVKSASSVILAILLEVKKQIEIRHKQLLVINLPENLKKLAQVSHLGDLFH